MNRTTTALLALLPLVAGSMACSKQPHALTASAAGQGSYALTYADELGAARAEMAAIETQVGRAGEEMAQYPAALSNPGWGDVHAVYELSDEAGRTSAYVEELEKDRTVASFYVDEKDELNRRIGGAAQYAAKQKQCDVELSGPTSYALGKGIDERIRDRMRGRSEAFQYIDDHEETLGKKNRPKLEDQSDAIAQTSYFVNVAAPRLEERLAQRLSDSSEVDRTLQRVGEESHKMATDDKLPAARRQKAQVREQAAIAARQRLAGEVQSARQLSEEMDRRVSALRDRYAAALKALLKDVEKRTP